MGSLLGRGGMGEVYRAYDSQLGRHVALKVLPDIFAADADRVARFTREAHVLAALNHPNIASIYGFHASDDVRALVLELVEGPTLADRIAHGAIPVDEALRIGRQIAEALEVAHEQGIVHCDLKPANIKLRSDGTVKVLDFGLARSLQDAPGDRAPSFIRSAAATHPGLIVGTAAYMSPEQAKARPADKSSDVWGFGAVLYEMLTGRRAFHGDDASETLAAVLRQDVDWTALPTSTPTSVRRLLARCLDRDVTRRLRDIREARLVLEDPGPPTDQDVAASAVHPARATRIVWLISAVALIGVIIAAALISMRPAVQVPASAGPVEFTIEPPANTSFGGPQAGGTGIATQVAISPDGRSIVFVAGAPPAYHMWLRPLTSAAATAIPGTEGGTYPFWSPDSRFIGFFANGKLKKVPVAGGPVTVLADALSGRGGSWSRDDTILFTQASAAGSGIVRVSSAGGIPIPLTKPDRAADRRDAFPHFLPDGRHFLYTASTGICCPAPKPSVIMLASLDSPDSPVPLFEAESSVSYARGHLVFARDETLMAQPFDADRRQPTGDAFPIAEGVSRQGDRYIAASVSQTGTLVYGRGDSLTAAVQLTWFDRTGHAVGTVGEPAIINELALSPDERRIAVSLGRPSSPENPNRDIWVIDVARNVRSRHTFDPGMDGTPVWSPDSSAIVFSGLRSGKSAVLRKLMNGAAEETLIDGEGYITPTDWSSDGRFLAFTKAQAYNSDIWILPMFGDRKPFPAAQGDFAETSAMFSPDRRWIAYASNEGGQFNVYVQRFPSADGKHQVSTNGGSQPAWRADGRELFYLTTDMTITAVPIDTDGGFEAGTPQPLIPTGAPNPGYGAPIPRLKVYAVTRDGRRFLIAAPRPAAAAPITVIVNWTSTLVR
jgi:Tol biopolymer transport system component